MFFCLYNRVMHTIWNILIYKPIFNTLIFLAQYITFKDVGIAVILLTIIIRLILMPISKKMIRGQYALKAIQPKLNALKARGLSKDEEAKETMLLYKAEKINPFSSCVYLLIQLPILFGIYFALRGGIDQPTNLYSFLSIDGLHNTLLGLIDITKPFLPFAILAGLTQSLQAFLAPKPEVSGDPSSFQNSFATSMSFQTKYILPILIIFIASKLAAAVAIYWVIANSFSIVQEFYFRKQFHQD